MQPLFQTPGWSLPTKVASEPTTKKQHALAADLTPEKATKEADRLQAQLRQITPKQPKIQKKRPLDDDPAHQSKRQRKRNKKNKNNAAEKQNDDSEPAVTPKKQQKTPLPAKEPHPQQQDATSKKQQQKQKKQQAKEQPKQPLEDASKDVKTAEPAAKNAKPDANKKAQLKALLEKQKSNKAQEQKKQQNQKQAPSAPKQPAKQVAKQPAKQPAPVQPKAQNEKAATNLTKMQLKMKEKLSGARFRWLNEKLYTTEGNEAFDLFQEKPELFDEYHEGFRHQVESWPDNPVDIILSQLRELPAGTVIADLGCGDAVIGHTLTKQKVLSFDLIAKNDKVIACDITKLPVPANFVDVAVFSLSLMGTNYIDFLKEAHRVLKDGGELKIAEVVSRFPDIDGFIELVEAIGFEFMDKDDGNKMFVMLYFTKRLEPTMDDMEGDEFEGMSKRQKRKMLEGAGVRSNLSSLRKQSEKLLKPCLYKRR